MCGIVGVFNFDRHQPVDEALLVAQAEAIAHRGPDDGAVHIEDGVGLGHRRLSIIDLENGSQPMWDLEHRLGVIFNGEIYNYRELRDDLAGRGHRFRTDSDTEVLLNAYREWGAECVDRFVGMFAFAVFDRRERSLYLARDRLGKKPLFYFRDGRRIIFASELKAILVDPSVPRVIDPAAVVDFFAYNYVPAPGTILQNVQKLPAGHGMLVTSGKVVLHRYWDPAFTPVDRGTTLDDSASSLTDALQDAVRLRLRSDVPLGAFLSGGVDSSLIVALMARALPHPVKTHTIGFSEAGYDERSYAREMATLYHTAHHERLVDVDAAATLDQLGWFYDEPFGDSSAVPSFHLSGATRERVTVALSGDGGDENFAGYRRYRFAMVEEQVRSRVPGAVRRAVFNPVAELYPKADFLPRYLRAKATLKNLAVSRERAYFQSLTQNTYRRFLDGDFLRNQSGYDPYVHFERHLARCDTKDPLARLQYIDLKMYLCDDILQKIDRASMAHGLEVRVPLLDHRLVDRVALMPSAHKLEGRNAKRALKRAASVLLPAGVLRRRKMGFVVPLPEWFRGGLKESTEALLFDQPGGTTGLFDPAGLRRLWYEHQVGLRNHATALWSIVMFEHWARRFLSSRSLLDGAVRPRACAPTRRSDQQRRAPELSGSTSERTRAFEVGSR